MRWEMLGTHSRALNGGVKEQREIPRKKQKCRVLEGVTSPPWTSCPNSLQLEDLLHCVSALGQNHSNLCNSPFSTLVSFPHINSDVWVSCLMHKKKKSDSGKPTHAWIGILFRALNEWHPHIALALSSPSGNMIIKRSWFMCIIHVLWETVYICLSFNPHKILILYFLKDEAQRC